MYVYIYMFLSLSLVKITQSQERSNQNLGQDVPGGGAACVGVSEFTEEAGLAIGASSNNVNNTKTAVRTPSDTALSRLHIEVRFCCADGGGRTLHVCDVCDVYAMCCVRSLK